ncbi:MAG: ankyrin repeat domain-containing protein [Capsulimonas sp.]|uniref:ankyrin repeat domain-containing protein n=1 Tax=Capsulimonas sp. TaxID=2494211 RepID=UPI0032670624
MTEQPTGTVAITRHFDASPEQIFDAWFDPESVGKWLFAPPDGKIPIVSIDARVGGRFTIGKYPSDENIARLGQYLEIDRPRRLVFDVIERIVSFKTTRVTVEIAPTDLGCEVTLTIAGVDAEYLDQTDARWAKMLVDLDKTKDAVKSAEQVSLHNELKEAIVAGDTQKISDLIAVGADIHYRDAHGYDAMINAIYASALDYGPKLMEMLRFLIENGVSTRGKTSYRESAVRVASNFGHFDAVHLLLNAGADPNEVHFTDLMKAVVFGTLADVERVAAQGVNFEERDTWERTAWLIAIQTGDVAKAKYLLGHGARRDARGRCGKPPLFYAIENGHSSMLTWLLSIGEDVEQTDNFGHSPLRQATEYGNVDAVDILLASGADVNREAGSGTALSCADGREIAMKLLAAGADPQELSSEGRRVILGYPSEPEESLLNVSVEEFELHYARRFGSQNPENMTNPFWEGMVRSGLNAYRGALRAGGDDRYTNIHESVWSADRFGQSISLLDDGLIIQIGGGHEDGCEYCVHNDVFTHDADGTLTIYGYPEAVFPPTDFHTATLVGEDLYLIGSLGYYGKRRFGETPVYRLNIQTFQMEPLTAMGDNPGWIYKHRAVLSGAHEITITGGTVIMGEGRESSRENTDTYILDLESLVWRVDHAG